MVQIQGGRITLKGDFMKFLDMFAWILLVVGGLNWGLVGLFNFNLVDTLFTAGSIVTMVVYTLVGAAAVYAICRYKVCCKSSCKK